jgi:iron complex outermembrane recepter protein
MLVVALAGEVIALPVWAQSSEQLEEVVVTARKRDESFHDVPITVNVFTQQQIQAAGIDSPRDFVAMVPNMTMVEVQNVGNSFITIRGISQARNSEPSVATVVDGVLETNPYEFSTALYDIRQIEVLKGPQGALYGRNAIAGAIIIHTADPSNEFEGSAKVGGGSGDSKWAQAAISGPLVSDGTLKYRASVNYYDTNGFIKNWYLDKPADPATNYSARLRLLWQPADSFSADLRLYYDRTETTAYYYVIPRTDEANPFSEFTTPPNANDVTSPIQVNNPGTDNRDIVNVSLKLDYGVEYGTFTSITQYDQSKEIDTGDAYDFRPVQNSFYYAFSQFVLGAPVGFDESQSQFIRVRDWSQELRFTSKQVGGFSWIAGAYFIHTERFVSTGNLADYGNGVTPVYETPRVDPTNPFADGTNQTFLADSQNNNAWAVFADATYEFSKQWELDAAIRYDEDTRQNTTDTPPEFLPAASAQTGEVRKHTWSKAQPKATLRYKPTPDWTIYGGYSVGFRSGGFNQTGVGAVAEASGVKGVGDLFDAEVVNMYELGVKGQMLDRRLSLDAAIFHSHSENGYFFVYLPANSTQNLGNLNATYKGAEIGLTARPTPRLDLYAGFGYTDGVITQMADPTVIGNKPPLLTQHTINAGAQYRYPLTSTLNATARLDYNQLGRTWWDPYNVTSRDPVDLVDVRLGLEAAKWSVTLWGKNITDTRYNAEFSPGNTNADGTHGAGFLWRALPARYGVDLLYRF